MYPQKWRQYWRHNRNPVKLAFLWKAMEILSKFVIVWGGDVLNETKVYIMSSIKSVLKDKEKMVAGNICFDDSDFIITIIIIITIM
jgi:hypothetical protein